MGDAQQTLHRHAGGLIANRNPYTAEEGTLLLGEDIISDRDGVIANRRGFDRYAAANGLAFGEFRGRILVLDGGTLRIDDGTGNLVSLGAFNAPTGSRMRFIEVQKSLLFTSSQGVMKLDSPTGTVRRAGMPPGLNVVANLTAGTWFPPNTAVAYRTMWVRVDANDQTISGEPSWRVIVPNDQATPQAVILSIIMPEGIIEGDYVEIYRTDLSADAITNPGDEEFLVARVAVTAADIAALGVIFHDTYDPIFLGAPLSTNSSQDGISQAHGRPPYATDLALYRGFLHYMGDLKREPELEFRLLDIAGITLGTDTITLSRSGVSRTYTFSSTQDPLSQKIKVETGFSLSLNLRRTAENICLTINLDPNNAFYAFYASEEDDPPGKIRIRDRSVNVGSFTLLASAGVQTKFSPSIPATGLVAQAMSFPNRVVTSRYQEYEHVPRSEQNRNDLGTTAAIVRGLALTTSIIFLKRDSVWRRTGDALSDFFDFPLDAEMHMVAPDAAAVLDNQVYCATVAGLVRISDSGVGLISWPIDQRLKRIFSFQNYDTISFAVANPAGFEYIFFAQEDGVDTFAKVGWRWNYLLSKWVGRIRKQVKAGYVLGDKIYLAHAVDGYVLKERKSWNTSLADYQDESIPVTVVSVLSSSSALVNYTYRISLKPGFVLAQPARFMSSRIATVTLVAGTNYQVTFDDMLPALQPGAATVTLPIFSEIHWRPETAGNPSVFKHWIKNSLSFEDEGARNFELGWYTDIDSTIAWEPRTLDDPIQGWGLGGWGLNPWGDSDEQRAPMLVSDIPVPYERSHSLIQCLRHQSAKERYSILDLSFTFEATGEE